MATKKWICRKGHKFDLQEDDPRLCPRCRSGIIHEFKPEGATVAATTEDDEQEDVGEVLNIFTVGRGARKSAPRLSTGVKSLDECLGRGLVQHSITLIAGEPGIGKSTLAMEVAANLADAEGPVLYVSAEQEDQEIEDFARRLGADSDDLYLASTSSVEEVIRGIRQIRPVAVFIDSINEMRTIKASEGKAQQIEECTRQLQKYAKNHGRGFALFLLGHITKDDSIAGPKTLEHLVDTVMTFVGTEDSRRFLRTGKNRHGPSGEMAAFEMTGKGLREIGMDDSLIVARREGASKGYCVFPCLDAARPFLVEVECRVGAKPDPILDERGDPRPYQGPTGERSYIRMSSQRMGAVLNILRDDAGVDLRGRDLFVETSNMLDATVQDASMDLAVAVAITSAALDIQLPPGLVACGGIGLSGQVRPVQRIETRMETAKRSNFTHALIPGGQPLARGVIGRTAVHSIKDLPNILRAIARGVTLPAET